jgi:glycosyltransferase involved in cell wall biosynthesis
MHQSDFSKLKEMNIQSDVVFANQADRFSYDEIEYNGHVARMITTAQRGVGKNRNTALLYATADICVFSDDDVRYVDGYREKIIDAFKEVKDADVLIFNLKSGSERHQKLNTAIKRVRFWNAMKYGAVRIVVKLEVIQKANIWFTTLFGGGCKYPSGEDSLWMIDALRKGLRIYTYPLIIGEVKIQESTWFKGYNEEYFFNRGAFAQAALPRIKYVIFMYYLVRFRQLVKLPLKEMIKLMCVGARCFKQGVSYDEWRSRSFPK